MKTRLGIIFGSRSVEHEVSIITAVQLMKSIDIEKYEIIPIYIDKSGIWWTGEQTAHLEAYKSQDLAHPVGFTPFVLNLAPINQVIDVAIVCCHGTLGEDGTVQGLLELAGIPYQGPGVVGSAICMDKIISKKIFEATGIPTVNFQWLTSNIWQANRENVLDRLLDPTNVGHKLLKFPLFVKPANLGSSVGITKATDRTSLSTAIDVASAFDRRILVEQGLENIKEINVSVLGFEEFEASVPEEPIASGVLLSYADKYEGGSKKTGGMASLKRRIPAPIPASLTARIQATAKQAAAQCDLSGVARLDFLVDVETDEYWLNEINTIPGSLSFYLWEASGVSYPELIERLVQIALKRSSLQASYTRSISTTIIK